MKMDPAIIETFIAQGVPEAQIYVEDLRGDGRHFAVSVMSPAFEGLTVLQQHQLVYASFGIHAAAIVEHITLYTAVAQDSLKTGSAG